jgi:hypothetical protein
VIRATRESAAGLKLGASLLPACVFLASAIPKLRNPKSFILTVRTYEILPQWLGDIFARVLAPVQLMLATFLLAGVAVRAAASGVAALLMGFIAAVTVNLVRGREFDCGCFGNTGWQISRGLLLVDGGLLTVALFLVRASRGRLAWWSPLRLIGSLGGEHRLALVKAAWAPQPRNAPHRSQRGATSQATGAAMSGGWLASYIALWTISLTTLGLLLGALRELALLRGRRGTGRSSDNGPALGTSLPKLTLESANGHETVVIGQEATGLQTLLVFMTPTCEGCQLLVEPLNAFAAARENSLRTIVVLSGLEVACRSFVQLFPLRMPAIVDTNHEIASAFGIHVSPSMTSTAC